ncbi:hypothetical protein [Tardiphaga sp. P9-11]|uniref:hypothetical protein n=1 Tax=Tardiphaga sp. P9-11 TaxID=2024614 RepID=UPI0011F29523|nr:hypothetical protein [Tardiphaga sp. P9-11]KAA0076094.1 hypothetical protein CIW50_07485 [Tardiphaga sp. P9-11]
MLYTTSMGSYTYTLQPDGSITANGGAARATRIGAAPPVPRSRDYGAASNVTADILGIDRSETRAPATSATKPTLAAVKPTAAASTPKVDPQIEKERKEGFKHFAAGMAAEKRGDLAAATDHFDVAAGSFERGGLADKAATAKANAKITYERQFRRAANKPKQVNYARDSLKCKLIKKQIDAAEGYAKEQQTMKDAYKAKGCEG